MRERNVADRYPPFAETPLERVVEIDLNHKIHGTRTTFAHTARDNIAQPELPILKLESFALSRQKRSRNSLLESKRGFPAQLPQIGLTAITKRHRRYT